MRILIAAGGTGGHVYPALAVARCLRERVPEVEFRWLGGHRWPEITIVPARDSSSICLPPPCAHCGTVDMNHHVVLDPVRLGISYLIALARPCCPLAT